MNSIDLGLQEIGSSVAAFSNNAHEAGADWVQNHPRAVFVAKRVAQVGLFAIFAFAVYSTIKELDQAGNRWQEKIKSRLTEICELAGREVADKLVNSPELRACFKDGICVDGKFTTNTPESKAAYDLIAKVITDIYKAMIIH